MLNCKSAARLLALRRERPLSARERMRLWFHLRLCAGCRRYDAQMTFLDRACRGFLARQRGERE